LAPPRHRPRVGAIPAALVRRLVHFFFEAEDGIRDRNVTGVQTCALPISSPCPDRWGTAAPQRNPSWQPSTPTAPPDAGRRSRGEIGRASCREREEIVVVARAVAAELAHQREGNRLGERAGEMQRE